MDKNYPIMDRIELVAAHLQLIADLMLAGGDLKDADRANFAYVMQDLATRLEQAVREKPRMALDEFGMDRECQP